jgi:hypothetical protein
MNSAASDIIVAIALLLVLVAAFEAGFRIARAAHADARASGQVGAVQGAILGLLGLLLGFSFAAAGARFLERQDLIVTEANAIGTAYLRADLLPEPHRARLRDALRDYTRYRVEISSTIRQGLAAAAHDTIQRQHADMWRAALEGANARPETILAVLPPVNDVIDLHSTRLAAGQKHLPALVMGLLIASSVLSLGTMGYASGIGGRRRAPLTVPLAFLIASSLWITIDLDHPRAGLMRLSDAPLEALRFDTP